MKTLHWGRWVIVMAVLGVAGCAGPAGVARLSEDSARLQVVCGVDPSVPNASYVGPYLGVENRLGPKDLAQDLYCANQFRMEKFRNGFVTILGDSRITERGRGSHYTWINELNNELYAQILSFAQRWSVLHGRSDGYPILTTGGPGLMEAAARGAMLGSGVSIGYGTYAEVSSSPAEVFAQYPVKGVPQPIISDGLIFSSVAMRDYVMLSQSAAIIVAPGGLGTHGNLFQILDMLNRHRLDDIPIYIVGDKKFYWSGWNEMKDKMILDGTITPEELNALKIEFVENPTQVIGKLEARLRSKE